MIVPRKAFPPTEVTDFLNGDRCQRHEVFESIAVNEGDCVGNSVVTSLWGVAVDDLNHFPVLRTLSSKTKFGSSEMSSGLRFQHPPNEFPFIEATDLVSLMEKSMPRKNAVLNGLDSVWDCECIQTTATSKCFVSDWLDWLWGEDRLQTRARSQTNSTSSIKTTNLTHSEVFQRSILSVWKLDITLHCEFVREVV